MQNFNTNQTRFLYVAGAIDANVDTNLDIALAQAATGEMYFKYKNADGLVTRSDTFDPKKIVSLKKTLYSSLAKPLNAFAVKVDSAITLSGCVGKTFNLNVTIHGVHDYDADNSKTITASVVGDSTNTASEGKFLKAVAKALVLALPKQDKNYPLIQVVLHKSGTDKVVTFAAQDSADFVDDATHLVIIQGAQKYVRGKLSGEPCDFSVASNLEGNVWHKLDKSNSVGVMTTASTLLESGTTSVNNPLGVALPLQSISGAYALADLEFFAAGEKGDMYRGFNYPNNYEFTPAINLATSYDVVSIEYYWAGDAENVQKSPRLIQVAAAHNASAAQDICTILYNTIDAAMAGVSSI